MFLLVRHVISVNKVVIIETIYHMELETCGGYKVNGSLVSEPMVVALAICCMYM